MDTRVHITSHVMHFYCDFHSLVANALVTCEIKLFQNYFSFRRHASEIISFQRVGIFFKLFQNYCTDLLQLMNIFQHVQCR